MEKSAKSKRSQCLLPTRDTCHSKKQKPTPSSVHKAYEAIFESNPRSPLLYAFVPLRICRRRASSASYHDLHLCFISSPCTSRPEGIPSQKSPHLINPAAPTVTIGRSSEIIRIATATTPTLLSTRMSPMVCLEEAVTPQLFKNRMISPDRNYNSCSHSRPTQSR